MKPNYQTITETYCEQVLAGEIVTCATVKQAVNRYLSDLQRINTADFPYTFNYDLAELYCMYFPIVLRHSVGEWRGQPFDLSPWQAFIHWNIHGWRRRDGSRRFRKVLCSMARKNGKTTWCSGVAAQAATSDINPMTGEPESVAQVLIGATKIDQARIMFGETVRMCQQSPIISKQCEITKQSVFFPGSQSVINPLASDKPFSGLNPSVMLFDEIHEFTETHRKFYDTMTTGGGSRIQPLQFIITTASDEKGLIYHQEFDYARSVLAGHFKDEQLFAIIYELDEDDDIYDESTWIKANPNLGVSVKLEYLQQQALEARNKPSFVPVFTRFHCNRCVKSVEQSVLPKTGELSDWTTADVIGFGLDLGGMDDLASIGMVAKFKTGEKDGEPVWRYEAKSKNFMSVQTRRDLGQQPWGTWIQNGDLNTSQYIFGDVQRELTEEMNYHKAFYFAFDPQFAGQMAEEMDQGGLTPVKMPQRCYSFNEPMLEMFSAISEGRFIIDENDPILLWAFGNLAIARDTQGRMMCDKKHSKDKIDPAVAVIMALKAAMADPGGFKGSYLL